MFFEKVIAIAGSLNPTKKTIARQSINFISYKLSTFDPILKTSFAKPDTFKGIFFNNLWHIQWTNFTVIRQQQKGGFFDIVYCP